MTCPFCQATVPAGSSTCAACGNLVGQPGQVVRPNVGGGSARPPAGQAPGHGFGGAPVAPPGPAPQRAPRSSRWTTEGAVLDVQERQEHKPRRSGCLPLLILLGALILLLASSPDLIASLTITFFPFILLLVGLLWLGSKLRMGGCLGSLLSGTMRGASPTPRVESTLVLRVDSGGVQSHVELAGHTAHEVQIGDHVEVVGPRLGGTVRALWIADHTIGTTLYRDNLIWAVVVLALATCALIGWLVTGGPS